MITPPTLPDKVRKAIEDLKLRTGRINELKKQKEAALQPFDAAIAKEQSLVDAQETLVREWAEGTLEAGHKVVYYGVTVGMRRGQPKVTIGEGIDPDALALQLAKSNPLLVVQSTTINKRAILDLAREEGSAKAMAALAKLGVNVVRETEVKVSCGK